MIVGAVIVGLLALVVIYLRLSLVYRWAKLNRAHGRRWWTTPPTAERQAHILGTPWDDGSKLPGS